MIVLPPDPFEVPVQSEPCPEETLLTVSFLALFALGCLCGWLVSMGVRL